MTIFGRKTKRAWHSIDNSMEDESRGRSMFRSMTGKRPNHPSAHSKTAYSAIPSAEAMTRGASLETIRDRSPFVDTQVRLHTGKRKPGQISPIQGRASTIRSMQRADFASEYGATCAEELGYTRLAASQPQPSLAVKHSGTLSRASSTAHLAAPSPSLTTTSEGSPYVGEQSTQPKTPHEDTKRCRTHTSDKAGKSGIFAQLKAKLSLRR